MNFTAEHRARLLTLAALATLGQLESSEFSLLIQIGNAAGELELVRSELSDPASLARFEAIAATLAAPVAVAATEPASAAISAAPATVAAQAEAAAAAATPAPASAPPAEPAASPNVFDRAQGLIAGRSNLAAANRTLSAENGSLRAVNAQNLATIEQLTAANAALVAERSQLNGILQQATANIAPLASAVTDELATVGVPAPALPAADANGSAGGFLTEAELEAALDNPELTHSQRAGMIADFENRNRKPS